MTLSELSALVSNHAYMLMLPPCKMLSAHVNDGVATKMLNAHVMMVFSPRCSAMMVLPARCSMLMS